MIYSDIPAVSPKVSFAGKFIDKRRIFLPQNISITSFLQYAIQSISYCAVWIQNRSITNFHLISVGSIVPHSSDICFFFPIEDFPRWFFCWAKPGRKSRQPKMLRTSQGDQRGDDDSVTGHTGTPRWRSGSSGYIIRLSIGAMGIFVWLSFTEHDLRNKQYIWGVRKHILSI